MRCREARTTFTELELGLTRAEARGMLATHLARCSDCTAWVSRERRLTASLATLRTELPFEIDVSARVATALGELLPASAGRVSGRELAWSGAVAAAASLSLALGLWQLTPGLAPLAVRLRGLGSALLSAASTLTSPVEGLVATVARVLGDLLASLGKVAGTLESLQPIAIATVAISTLMMAVSIVLVVGRDLRRPHWIEEESRT